MDFLIQLINSPILYVISLAVVLLLVFSGKIKIKEGKLSVNDSREKERQTIRSQVEYTRAFCDGLQRVFPQDEKRYRQLFVIEQFYNEGINALSFNHLSLDGSYISVKQEVFWNKCSAAVDDERYRTQEFKEVIFERTKKLIEELIKIRNLNK